MYSCPVCGTRLDKEQNRPPDVYHCSGCGLGYTWPPPLSGYPGEGESPLRPLPPRWRISLKRLLLTFLGRGGGWIVRGVLPPFPQARALDVGCGDGYYVRAMAALGWRAVGVERDRARAQRAASMTAASVMLATGEALPVASSQYHLVTLWHVLEHIPQPRQALEESFRVLKSGGLLLVEVPHASAWQARLAGARWFHRAVDRHYWHFTPSTLRQLVRLVGFSVDTLHSWPNAPGWQYTWSLSRAFRGLFWLIDGGAALLGHGGVLRLVATKP